MKFLIQQTDSSGKTIFIEKVAKCTPRGDISMTSDVFEEANCEQQFDVDYMKEGKEKIQIYHSDVFISLPYKKPPTAAAMIMNTGFTCSR